MTAARAAVLSSLWLAAGLLAAGPVLLFGGSSSAVQYLAAYLVERSLSLDNVFAFLLVLDTLAIPPASRPRVIRRGIAVALVTRAAAIACGAALIGRLDPISYTVGALLVAVGWRALRRRPRADDLDHRRPGGLVRRLRSITTVASSGGFVVHEGRRWSLTPLGLALIALALADVSLAADSIPAALAITTDVPLIWLANVLALLGLVPLLVLARALLDRLRYMSQTVGALLIFVGLRLLLGDVVMTGPLVGLAGIVGILAAGTAASLWTDRSEFDLGAHDHDALDREPVVRNGAGGGVREHEKQSRSQPAHFVRARSRSPGPGATSS